MRARWAHHRQFDSALEEQSRDGRWAMVREYPTGDGGFALVLTDITDLKQREASLSEARDAAGLDRLKRLLVEQLKRSGVTPPAF